MLLSRRQLSVWFAVLLVVASLAITLFGSFLPGSIPKASAEANTVVLDMQRSILRNFSNCIVRAGGRDSSVIDIHRGYVHQWDDLIGDYMDDDNYVVGMEVDNNGVLSCLDIIPLGVNVLIERSVSINQNAGQFTIRKPGEQEIEQKGDVTNWLSYYGTGYTLDQAIINKIEYNTGDFARKLVELKTLADVELSEIGAQTSQILQRRYIRFFNVCFNSSTTKIQDPVTSVGDFEWPDTGYFYRIPASEILEYVKSETAIWTYYTTDNTGPFTGATRHLKVDDIQVGEWQTNTIDNWFDDEFSNEFYPLGSDTPPVETAAQPFVGMAGCDIFTQSTVREALFSYPVKVENSKLAFADDNPNAQEPIVAPEDGTDGVAQQDNCDSAADFAFSFVLCPILALMDTAIGWLDDRIVSAMSIDNSYYETTEIKQAWGNIRNIAYVLLIPIMLVMVIGTALQFSFLDPYTVKRALPRMFVGIIFIALSYEICTIVIEIVDGIGRGIGGLVASPFGGFENLSLQDVFKPPEGNNAQQAIINGSVLLAGVGVAFFSGVTIWSLFVFFGVAALALLIIFLLLSVREMMVIFLVVVSPLAIIAWIFPGNDKPWKLWYQTFTKMLYLFPVIMAILAIGRGFASIVDVAGDGGISTIVKLVAFIGPYFFIPKAFQMAGGALGNLAGMVNDRSKGVFDRAKKSRQESMKNKREAIKTGKAFRTAPPGSRRQRFNQRAMSAANMKEMGLKGIYNKEARQSRIQGAKDRIELEEFKHVQEDFALSKMLANDDFSQALMSGKGNEAKMLEYLKNKGYSDEGAASTVASLRSKIREHGLNSVMGAAVVAKAGSKTSYIGGQGELMSDVALAAEGNSGVAHTLMFAARAAAEQGGRLDLSRGSGGEASMELEQIMGAGSQAERAQMVRGTNLRMAQKAVEGMSAHEMTRVHPSGTRNLVNGIQYGQQQVMSEMYDSDTALYQANTSLQAAQQAANANPGSAGAQRQLRVATQLQRSAERRNVSAHRAVGQKAAELQNINQAMPYFAPEASRILNEGLDRGIEIQSGRALADGTVPTVRVSVKNSAQQALSRAETIIAQDSDGRPLRADGTPARTIGEAQIIQQGDKHIQDGYKGGTIDYSRMPQAERDRLFREGQMTP